MLFYHLLEAGFHLRPPQSEIKNQIEVAREFRTENDEGVNSIPLDSKVRVVVSLRAIAQPVSNVAILDMLPGGLEVDISPEGIGDRRSLVQSPNTWTPDYIDVREDRVIFLRHDWNQRADFHLPHAADQPRQLRGSAALRRGHVRSIGAGTLDGQRLQDRRGAKGEVVTMTLGSQQRRPALFVLIAAATVASWIALGRTREPTLVNRSGFSLARFTIAMDTCSA